MKDIIGTGGSPGRMLSVGANKTKERSKNMRGVYTSVNDIRKMVFAEVARLSYDYKDGNLSQMDQIPYRIIPGEVSTYRESVFLERAIVRERMRLAMGLPLRDVSEHAPV